MSIPNYQRQHMLSVWTSRLRAVNRALSWLVAGLVVLCALSWVRLWLGQ